MHCRNILFSLAAAAFLAGCSSSRDASKSNFKAAIDKAISKKCVAVGPGISLLSSTQNYPQSLPLAQVSPLISADIARKLNERLTAPYEALVNAGLLDGKDGLVPTMRNSSRSVLGRTYSLTEIGKKYLLDKERNDFCAAYFKVDEVTEYTEPSTTIDGAMVSIAKFTYSPVDIAYWAKSKDLQEAYPGLNKRLAESQQGDSQMTLAHDGWNATIRRGFFQ